MSSNNIDTLSQQYLAADPRSINAQVQAQKDPRAAARQAASQFEALLINIFLKEARATRFNQDENSDSLSTYQSLYDQQLAQSLSTQGGFGVGEIIYRELLKQSGLKDDKAGQRVRYALPGLQLMLPARRAGILAYQTQQTQPSESVTAANTADRLSPADKAFMQNMLPYAEGAATTLGVSPATVVAHAALESGWGKHAIQHPDGSPSYNLFGIKAGQHWHGQTVRVVTTEYENGMPRKSEETFRSYGSYAEAFNDYANLLKRSPRYQNALNQGNNIHGFAVALQAGGYATDPRYAYKLTSVAEML